ncbi:MAG TPA: hypothetical protein VFN70_18295 [Burkholderiales bacterium]|nr:hypothetical protein [Burkholderiales bacterium]
MSIPTSMMGETASVEVDTCSAQSTRQPSLIARAAPARKRSPWDHCSPTTDSEFGACDFHEDKFRRTGEQ